MKFSVALLFTLVICFAEYVSAELMPLEKVLKNELNMSAQEFKKICDSQPNYSIKELLKSRIVANKIREGLADDIVNRAKKLPKVEEKNWDQLVEDRCHTNYAIKVLSDLSVDNINKCLDKNDRVKGHKKVKVSKELFKGYCDSVKKLAKKKSEKK